MIRPNTRYQGSCHCGAVAFQFVTSEDPPMRCNCSLCKRKGAVMITAKEQTFEIIKGNDSLSLYQWNTGVAEHYFCQHCGIYTHHKPRSNPNTFRANAGCLDGVDPLELEYKVVNGAALS